jgi:hypothetical protein
MPLSQSFEPDDIGPQREEALARIAPSSNGLAQVLEVLGLQE